jgi:hypothetical protein
VHPSLHSLPLEMEDSYAYADRVDAKADKRWSFNMWMGQGQILPGAYVNSHVTKCYTGSQSNFI